MKKDYNVQMLSLVLVMTMREKYTEVKDNKRKQPQQSSKLKSLHRFLPIKKHENITHKTGQNNIIFEDLESPAFQKYIEHTRSLGGAVGPRLLAFGKPFGQGFFCKVSWATTRVLPHSYVRHIPSEMAWSVAERAFHLLAIASSQEEVGGGQVRWVRQEGGNQLPPSGESPLFTLTLNSLSLPPRLLLTQPSSAEEVFEEDVLLTSLHACATVFGRSVWHTASVIQKKY